MLIMIEVARQAYECYIWGTVRISHGALSASLMGSVVKPNIWEQPTEDFTSSSLHEGGKMAVECVMDMLNRFA